jgi:hypothetical protein
MPYGFSCCGTRGDFPALALVINGYVSIRELVTLVACGKQAIDSLSTRSTVRTSSILQFIKRFDLRPTLAKSVHRCILATQQIRRIHDRRLVEPS